MMKHLVLATALVLVLASCTQPFKKSTNGIEYKIDTDGKGSVVKPGNFIEFAINQRYKGANKDTMYANSADFANQMLALDSSKLPPVFYSIFKQVRKGDSVTMKQISDSFMVQSGGQAPPFVKKGGHVFFNLKIVNIYETREAADSAYKVQMNIAKQKDSIKSVAQLKKDDKTISDFLAKNKITAIKAPQGTYVQIINPGMGDVLDTSKVVKVLYTGKTMEGKVFDSNTDPAFNHAEAYPVYLGAPAGSSVIKGWTDGLLTLRKGAKAVLYIPSTLAYGPQSKGEIIKANENLVFDVEVVDALTVAQANAEMEVMQKKREADQKRQMDSARNAQKLQDTSKHK